MSPARGLLALLATWLLFAGQARAQLGAHSELVFEALPELPNSIGLGGPVAGAHGGALIVAGGANFPTPLGEGGAKVWHDEVYVLLEGESGWRAGQTLPRALAYAACASSPRGVAVVGGSDGGSVYADVMLMTWDSSAEQVLFGELPALPVASAFGAAEVIGETLYVLGGKASKDEADLSGSFYALDLAAPQGGWVQLPAHPGQPRYKAVTAVQRGPGGESCLFLFSGSRTSERADGSPRFEMFTDGYRYSPSRRAWTRLADMPVLDDPRDLAGGERFADDPWPINAASAAAFGEREILTFSGSTGRYILDGSGRVRPPSERPLFSTRVLAYDTLADSWSDVGRMSEGVVTTHAVTWAGRIAIPSGEVKPGIRTPAVQALVLPTEEDQGLFGGLDYLVLGLYLAVMVGVGLYFARRETSTEEFFLAGRRIPWWAAGLSIFGTQLSAITFMAIPATSYGSDWRRFVGQLMVLPILVVVIYGFLPLFRKLEITTAYEYLEARFSVSVRVMSSALFILFQLGRMGIVLLLPAIALSAVTGMSTYLCILLMGGLATAYTALGGISAVIWTDVLQVVVLIGGALLCLVIAVNDVGGLGAMIETAQASEKFHMFDWRWSTTEMVGWVLIVGFLFTNLVPYTTDQTVIQRYLTTRDETQAARSLWLNLAITLPTGLLFFGLGTALFVYYSEHPVEQSQLPPKADQLVPWFVVTHLPAGVAGVVVAGIFAAAMSSLDSSINSITTAVVNDFVERFKPSAPGRDPMRFARTLTVVLGVIGTGAAMFLATYEIKYLFDFFQKIMGLFGGGLAGVFLLAVFTKRGNATGALAGLVSGGMLTIAAAYFTEVHFLLYAVIGTLTCVVVGYTTSLLTGGAPAHPSESTIGTH